MPLYEFKCDDCGKFELWRSMAESSHPAYCPSCQTLGKRIFSPPAVNLSSSLPLRKISTEPELVTKKRDREPTSPKFQTPSCGRPWMLNH